MITAPAPIASGNTGINVKTYGAVGNGTSSDTAIITALANRSALYFPAGTYVLSENVTFTGHVTMENGAVLQLAATKAVTFNGGFTASVSQVFKRAGSTIGDVGIAVFSGKKTVTGYPEWWGAVVAAGDATNATNNNTCLDACVQAVAVTSLSKTDYWIQTTWNIRTESVTIKGVPGELGTGAGGTRIIIRSATADVMQIGLAAYDADNNNWLANVRVEDLELTRDRGVEPPAGGSESTGCAGVRLKWTLYTFLVNVWSRESIIGFACEATVQPHFTKCYAARAIAKDGAAPNADYWWGWFMNGYPTSPFPAANASAFFTDCNASLGGVISSTGASPITSVGFNMSGPCSDLFFLRCETLKTQKGMMFGGVGAGGTATQRLNGHIDVQVMGCIVDQFSDRGIMFQDMPTGACVIVGGGTYAAAAGSAPIACYEVRDSTGIIVFAGAQAISNSVPSTIGLYVVGSTGVDATGLAIQNSQRPVTITTSGDCRICPTINIAADSSAVPTQAAVYLSTANRCYVAPAIRSASANKYSKGVELVGAANTYCEVNCTLINTTSLTGGLSANKLRINGVDVTAKGASGTHEVSGVMA